MNKNTTFAVVIAWFNLIFSMQSKPNIAFD